MAAREYPMFDQGKVIRAVAGTPTRRVREVTEEQRPQVAQSHNEEIRVATFHEQSLCSEGGATFTEADPELSEPPRQNAKDGERETRKPKRYPFMREPTVKSRLQLADLTEKHQELGLRLLNAEATIREKEMQINGLTETISRLHLREGELAKDDVYFSTQFSDIARSVTEWTLRHIPREPFVEIVHLSQLPGNLRQLISYAVPMGEDLGLLSKRASRLRVINSVVLEYLYGQLFCTLPGAIDAGKAISVIASQLQGTDFQRQRWRSLTYNLLTKGTGYEMNFYADVHTLAQDLGQLVSVLAPAPAVLDPGQRNDELLKLVECAARVSVEARKQLDVISFDSPKPGMPFDAETMDDNSCTSELDELMAGGATVQIALCPTIWRQSCNSDGSLCSQPSLVMKSKVWTVMSGEN